MTKTQLRVLKWAGLALAIISGISFCFQSVQYNRMRKDYELRHRNVPSNALPEVVEPNSFTVERSNYDKFERTSWRKFISDSAVKPKEILSSRLAWLDFADPDFDSKEFLKLFLSLDSPHYNDVIIEAIGECDMFSADLPPDRRNELLGLFLRLLKQSDDSVRSSVVAGLLGKVRMKGCRLDRFLKYALAVESCYDKTKDMIFLSLKSRDFSSDVRLHLKNLKSEDRRLLKGDLVQFAGQQMFDMKYAELFD